MSRNYRGDIDVGCIEKFMPLLMEQEDEGRTSPIIQKGELSYIYIKHMNIYRLFRYLQFKALFNFSGSFGQKEPKCCNGALVPVQMRGNLHLLLQGFRGGVGSGQFCGYLRVVG